ncbi:MAG: serine/threonine-protein kinase [Mycobacteriales bacterium]|nr:serine/threonine-protein kinase [Mycobacteriales bacterium]
MSDETVAIPTGGDRLVAGRYLLTAVLGRGGSAEVWRAHDEALDRWVALKLVTASGGDDAARVGDEARLLARLSHPGLVPVYDAGTDEAARPWVVMELVEGETLADAIRRGAQDPLTTAALGRTLADALAYVHGQGMVHRDVKPANVLLGREGRVRLTDFGIARLIDAAKVTATGFTVGTASYLAPEQVTGSVVGPPADVYALGLVLLEALTGEREYPGTAVEVALARLHRQPAVPDSLPTGWPGLLRAMTALEPEKRPSAGAVATELGHVVAGGTATTVLPAARPAPRPAAADRTTVLPRVPAAAPAPVAAPSRNGWKWAVALVAVLGAVVGGLIAYDAARDGRAPEQVIEISEQLPPELRKDLEDLRKEVAR